MNVCMPPLTRASRPSLPLPFVLAFDMAGWDMSRVAAALKRLGVPLARPPSSPLTYPLVIIGPPKQCGGLALQRNTGRPGAG